MICFYINVFIKTIQIPEFWDHRDGIDIQHRVLSWFIFLISNIFFSFQALKDYYLFFFGTAQKFWGEHHLNFLWNWLEGAVNFSTIKASTMKKVFGQTVRDMWVLFTLSSSKMISSLQIVFLHPRKKEKKTKFLVLNMEPAGFLFMIEGCNFHFKYFWNQNGHFVQQPKFILMI